MRCQAKSKQSGEQCKRHAVPGKNVCAIHGGKSLAGVASPNYKTGIYSKYAPKGILNKYHEALADEQLESLNSESALVYARIADLLSRIEVGEAGAAWQQMRQLYDRLSETIREKKAKDTLQALGEMDTLITSGVTEAEHWQEIYGLIELRRKLSETERRRLVDMQQYITSQQAMIMVGTLLGIIKARVDDRNVLAAIQHDVNALLASPR